jgi:hypothetical protein
VYELGLRKHAAFLTRPGYVSCYAQLLLELGDAVNLRALLTRAISACEQVPPSQDATQSRNSASSSLAVLWDLYLRFESVLSGADPLGASKLQEIERSKRQAVMGPDVEDVATGGLLATSDAPLIGAQKSTISEQLVRAEGYDASSSIVSGLSRTVDLLGAMGLWGDEALSSPSSVSAGWGASARQDRDLEISGGASDASFHRRLQFQIAAASGMSADSLALEGAGGAKLLSARERLMQQSGASAAAGGGAAGQPTAMMLAIQQSPEWLRPLLLLLPASRLRLPIVSKPPLQITELALGTLRVNPLPAERPADDAANGSSSGKRGRAARGSGAAGGDSSDEEDLQKGQGYGNLFRNRQRARIAAASVPE